VSRAAFQAKYFQSEPATRGFIQVPILLFVSFIKANINYYQKSASKRTISGTR